MFINISEYIMQLMQETNKDSDIHLLPNGSSTLGLKRLRLKRITIIDWHQNVKILGAQIPKLQA